MLSRTVSACSPELNNFFTELEGQRSKSGQSSMKSAQPLGHLEIPGPAAELGSYGEQCGEKQRTGQIDKGVKSR